MHLDNHFGCANISQSPSPTAAAWLSESGYFGKETHIVLPPPLCTTVMIKIQQNHWKQLESRPGCHLPDMWKPPLASATDRPVSFTQNETVYLGIRLWQQLLMRLRHQSDSLALVCLENDSGCLGVFYELLLEVAAPTDVSIFVCIWHISMQCFNRRRCIRTDEILFLFDVNKV